MAGLGAAMVVVREGKVLLILREDFPVWALPAGAVDPGESVAEAAVREVREETGLVVEIERLVGIYSRPGWFGGQHQVVFLGRAVGGELTLDPREALEARYFGADELPARLLWWYRPILEDALAGVGGSVAATMGGEWPFDAGLSRAELYTMRDRGEITPETMEKFWVQPEADLVRRDAGGERQG